MNSSLKTAEMTLTLVEGGVRGVTISTTGCWSCVFYVNELSEDKVLIGACDIGIKVFQTLSMLLAGWCSVEISGKMLLVLFENWVKEGRDCLG